MPESFQVDTYSHNFAVSGFDRKGRDALIQFAMDFAEYDIVRRWTGEYDSVLKRFYAAATKERTEFRFNINSLPKFFDYMERVGFPKYNMRVEDHPYKDPVRIDVEMKDHVVLRDYQVPLVDYMVQPGCNKVVTLQTGRGKTIVALASMIELGLRTVIAIRGMYVDRWLMDLTGPNSVLKTKKGDVMVVRGTKDLRNLIDLAIDDELEAKIIIITNKTLYTFFEHYERWPEDRVMYGCSPIELYDVLGAGLRIIDEVHQDFHLNFRQDLYTNIHKTISLSATLESDSPVINRMYEVMFPLGMRVDKGEYHKYISVHAIMYRLHDPYRIRHTQRGRNSYSHVAFEEFIMERKPMLRNYLDMIETCVWKYFTGIDDRKPGQRMLVFAATVEMCEKITKYLREKYADLSINKYTSEDEYEVLLNSDITVSTLLSAGTAVDVPGLRVCLVTTAIGSTQANLQALGRLRELKDFPGVTPLFLYFTCTDIDAHMRYHERKLERFEGKVICHKIVEMGLKL